MIKENAGDIKQLMHEGFKQAFAAQIGQLYKVYLSNVTNVDDQREYTKKGLENAIAAYCLAIDAVNEWES